MAYVIDPALHTGIKFRNTDVAGAILLPVLPQTLAEVLHVARFDATMLGIDDEPEPGDAMSDRRYLRLRKT